MGKKASILGSGVVGQTLAGGFLRLGYDVVLGTGHPGKEMRWESPAAKGTPVMSYADAAEGADIVVLAVKGTAAESVVKELAPKLAGKTVMDVTNPIAETPPENGVIKFFTDLDESLMERLQKLAPSARFVKAFNSVGNALMVNPDFRDAKPTMFVCGNDADAKAEIVLIAEKFGWETEDMGGAQGARAIEPLCMLWCIPGLLRSEWMHAFKLLKK